MLCRWYDMNQDVLREIKVIAAVSIWFTLLILVVVWVLATLVLAIIFPFLGFPNLVIIIVSLLIPLDVPCPLVISWFMAYSIKAFEEFLPVKVLCEDGGSFGDDGPYMIAYEPHGVLPQGMCTFCHVEKPAGMKIPKNLDGAAILVSDGIFYIPLLRHLFWWLGCRPVSRSSMECLLDGGSSVALCPGGVHECLLMEQCVECVYLKRRRGFIHLAMQKGASIVPCFGIGQSDLYKYWRPLYDPPTRSFARHMFTRLSRSLGFAPMLAWGQYGTPVPYRNQLTIVIGRPIKMPRIPDIQLDDARVEEMLGAFIDKLRHVHRFGLNSRGIPHEKPLIIY